MDQIRDLKLALKESVPAVVIVFALALLGNLIQGMIGTVMRALPPALGFIGGVGRMFGTSVDTGLTYGGLLIAFAYLYVRLAYHRGVPADAADATDAADAAD